MTHGILCSHLSEQFCDNSVYMKIRAKTPKFVCAKMHTRFFSQNPINHDSGGSRDSMYVCMYICMYVSVHTYVCMYLCMYVY